MHYKRFAKNSSFSVSSSFSSSPTLPGNLPPGWGKMLKYTFEYPHLNDTFKEEKDHAVEREEANTHDPEGHASAHANKYSFNAITQALRIIPFVPGIEEVIGSDLVARAQDIFDKHFTPDLEPETYYSKLRGQVKKDLIQDITAICEEVAEILQEKYG